MLLAAVLSVWLQYGGDGKPHVRAVVSDAACPSAVVDARTLPLARRAVKTAQFDDLVCDAAIPSGSRKVRIGTRALPAPAHAPRTIVVLGDTGCRIGRLSSQACDDPAAWPFPAIARAIAAVRPDLIVHVGDYLYRENACPPLADCKGSPYGDSATTWYADFLTPAAPLFAAAPMVLLRGNHETCDRNGAGWFRYLDARTSTDCSETTPPYAVDTGGLRLVAFDSAVADDRAVHAERAALFKAHFAAAAGLVAAGEPAWFITHRPPYVNADERAAMGEALVPFDAVLAGHIHFFAAMNVASLPPLLINGEGGAVLDPNYSAFLRLAAGDLHVVGDVFGASRFGFGVYTRAGSVWTISLRDATGTERARCTLAPRSVHCRSGE